MSAIEQIEADSQESMASAMASLRYLGGMKAIVIDLASEDEESSTQREMNTV